ncbi:MAG: beta-lactamase family protein [Deltaproteobacteria bacterium]|nr:beta-lactamase family protein [Deltaproteobacteria bacterium]
MLLTLSLAILLQGFFVDAFAFEGESPALKEKWQIGVDAIMQPAIEAKRLVGAVVGIITPEGMAVYGYGATKLNGKDVPDGDTVFYIASITKTVTSLVLAQMAENKDLKLTDPVAKFLPQGVTVPHYKGREITLLDLSTHHSGLPLMPSNFDLSNPVKSFKAYDTKMLYDFLSDHKLKYMPGTRYEYSNLGAGLLGHVLSLKSGKTYEDLVTDLVLKPLKMHDTGQSRNKIKNTLVTGYDWDLQKRVPWPDKVILEGAGALYSTAHDMLRYLGANMGFIDSPLGKAMQITHVPKKKAQAKSIGLGWFISDHQGQTLVWHNGDTPSCSSWAGFIKSKNTGVVVLANTSTLFNGIIDDAGLNVVSLLLGRSYKPFIFPEEVKIKSGLLKEYSGEYRSQDAKKTVQIKPQAGGLWVVFSKNESIRFYAASETSFFSKLNLTNLVFKRDNLGTVSRLIFNTYDGDEAEYRRAR